jgi:hypothetical protein
MGMPTAVQASTTISGLTESVAVLLRTHSEAAAFSWADRGNANSKKHAPD